MIRKCASTQNNFIKEQLHDCAIMFMTGKSQHKIPHIVFVIPIGIRGGKQGRAGRSGGSVWCFQCQTMHTLVEGRLHRLNQNNRPSNNWENGKRDRKTTERRRKTHHQLLTRRCGAGKCAVLTLRKNCKDVIKVITWRKKRSGIERRVCPTSAYVLI